MTKEKEEIKICNICRLGIDDSKEYAEFIHYKSKDNVFTKAYYHINCFRTRMLGIGEIDKIKKLESALMNFAKDKLGMTEKVNIG